MKSKLEVQLEQELLNACQLCHKNYGYHPARFLQMLKENGPVLTAIKLVMDKSFHEGFTKMWEFGRLDLTLEAIILREPYCQLFNEEVIERARERLSELGYQET